ncbi:MAG: transposase, partial [Alphaproteobacteria bacterium]|nr:transposase [Alphaproteobacteria bacterium]
DFCHEKIYECDKEIESTLERIAGPIEKEDKAQKKRRKNELYFNSDALIQKLTGIDLTQIDGLESHSVLKILSEIGTNMNKWPSVKHFASWLGLAPGTKISGGKRLSTRTKRCKNKAATVFRIAAYTLSRSKSALGAFLRRKKAQLGAPEAITATAHKIAKIFYIMLKEKIPYQDLGADYYEQKYKDRVLKNIMSRAQSLGYVLLRKPENDVKKMTCYQHLKSWSLEGAQPRGNPHFLLDYSKVWIATNTFVQALMYFRGEQDFCRIFKLFHYIYGL